ncbi:hypothetical protein HK098_006068 [Nowakowskiella sp. JEL0407]|nr:hypothetical protein HK098_006068 [Nowakowskiella sp. JEL0407]
MKFTFEGNHPVEQDLHPDAAQLRTRVTNEDVREPKAITIPTHDWETSPEAFRKLLFLYLDGNFHPGRQWHFSTIQVVKFSWQAGGNVGLRRYGIDKYDESDFSIIAEIQAVTKELKIGRYSSNITRIDSDIIDVSGNLFPMRIYVSDGDADANTGFFGGAYMRDSKELVAVFNGYAGDCATKILMVDNEATGKYEPHGDVYTKELSVGNHSPPEEEIPTKTKKKAYDLYDSLYGRAKDGKCILKRTIKVDSRSLVKTGSAALRSRVLNFTETIFSTYQEFERILGVAANYEKIWTPFPLSKRQSLEFRRRVVQYVLKEQNLSAEIVFCIAAFLPPLVYASVNLGETEKVCNFVLARKRR